jgi:hypothetical protein
MNVIRQGLVVISILTIQRDRLEAVPKQPTLCEMPDVVAAGDRILQPTHTGHQIGLWGLNEKMARNGLLWVKIKASEKKQDANPVVFE